MFVSTRRALFVVLTAATVSAKPACELRLIISSSSGSSDCGSKGHSGSAGSRHCGPGLRQPPPRRQPPPSVALLSATVPSDAPPVKQQVLTLRVATLFSLCTGFSLLSDMLTKHILRHHARDGLGVSVTFFQFAMSSLCGMVLVPLLQWSRRTQLRQLQQRRQPRAASPAEADSLTSRLLGVPSIRAIMVAIWPLALCQAGGFLATNLSLKFVPVSFSHTVKACECLFTATLAFLVLGQTLSKLAYAALVPTAVGVALSAATEMHFSAAGFIFAMASNLCFAGRSVLSTRFLQGERPLPASTLYWLLCCTACLSILPPFLLGGGPALFTSSGGGALLLLLCACGASHFTYNLLSFEILQLTSPVTHVVLHALRRILVIASSSALSAQPISPLNWSGIALASSGVLGYSLAQ